MQASLVGHAPPVKIVGGNRHFGARAPHGGKAAGMLGRHPKANSTTNTSVIFSAWSCTTNRSLKCPTESVQERARNAQPEWQAA